MENRTSELVIYGRTYDEAIDVICRRGLLHCEPELEPFHGFHFSNVTDQVLVAVGVADEAEFEGNLIIASPMLRAKVEGLINQMGMGSRVQRVDLLGIRFWNTDDQRAFNEEWGL